mmetsp:Transcript_9213/g.11055  ORF Transcript_9213/g.11055 Transcript_9213/m.11055 type:complete len:80 (+) Transcript_9213:1040-1279(+)
MLTSNSSTSKYVDPKDTLIPADINAVSWVIQALDVDQDTFLKISDAGMVLPTAGGIDIRTYPPSVAGQMNALLGFFEDS